MLLLFNLFILFMLLALLTMEELRFHSLKKHAREGKQPTRNVARSVKAIQRKRRRSPSKK